jgi:hypothetical protein
VSPAWTSGYAENDRDGELLAALPGAHRIKDGERDYEEGADDKPGAPRMALQSNDHQGTSP